MASATAEESRAIEILQEALQNLQQNREENAQNSRPSMRLELRSLEFWRAIIAECLGSFLYVFLVCGAIGQQTNNVVLSNISAALASGLGAMAIIHCFGGVSGAHISPAVTVAMAATRNISPLRGLMFVTAQCGGGIAGAALLYGVSASPGLLQLAAVPGSNVGGAPAAASAAAEPWQMFGQEMVLAFLVVLCYFVTRGSARAPSVGAAYLAASLAALPSLNPARALGPAFVLHKWDSHWVFWFGPLLGGMMAGMLYEFILNPRRNGERNKGSSYGDASSVHSDPDNYEDLDKGLGYNSLRGQQPISPMSPAGVGSSSQYCVSMKNGPEPIYSPRSMYTKSPPLTRANLNRSQSVYAKTPPAALIARTTGGPPLLPAQSLYPGMVCRTSMYNMPRPVQPNMYNVAPIRQHQQQQQEPIYGRQQSSPAEESSYGSYKHNKPTRDYHHSPNY